MKARLRAVVLAAGYGRRLGPLTERAPKPALPVLGRPVAGRTLERLARLGCEAAAVNCHHLAERLRAGLGDRVGGMPVVYSREERIQGTLGALTRLREFLEPAELVVVVNGDSLCRWPFARLVERQLEGRAEATLLVSRRADPAAFGGGVGLDGRGDVVALRGPGGVRRRVFAGAQAFSPVILRDLDPGPAGLVTGLYEPVLAAGGRLGSVETGRPWFDLGTPERYRAAVLEWLEAERPGAPSWSAPAARIEPSARLRRAVVETGSAVEAGGELIDTVVLPGALIGEGARLRGCLVGFDARVAPGAEIERRLVVEDTVVAPLAGLQGC